MRRKLKKVLVVLMTAFLVALLAGQIFAAPKPVTIRFMYWADGEQKKVVEQVCKKFNRLNPDIIVKPEAKPSDLNFDAMMATLIGSKNLPDCSYMGETDTLRYYEKGVLADLSSFFKKDLGKKLDAVTIKSADGKTIAAGLSDQVMILYYNKDLFDKAKMEYPPASPDKAWDWNKFIDVATKMTVDANGKHPNESGFDPNQVVTYGVNFSFFFQFSFMWAMNSNGGGTVSPNGKELWFNKPESVDALQKLADLINKYKVHPVVGSNQAGAIGGVDQALLSNKVAMFISGSWDIANAGRAKRENGLNYGIAALPKLKVPLTMNCGAPLVIYKTSKHLAQAKRFYKFMMDPEQVLDIIKTGAWLPNEEKWYTDPALLAKWIDSPNFPPEARTLIPAYALKYTAQWPAYACPSWSRMGAQFDPAWDALWAGKKTAQETVDSFMPKIKPIFASGKAND